MENKITLYTGDSCFYCKMVKAYLEAKGIPFTERNINSNVDYLDELTSRGIATIPTALINGEYITMNINNYKEILDNI